MRPLGLGGGPRGRHITGRQRPDRSQSGDGGDADTTDARRQQGRLASGAAERPAQQARGRAELSELAARGLGRLVERDQTGGRFLGRGADARNRLLAADTDLFQFLYRLVCILDANTDEYAAFSHGIVSLAL